MGIESDWIWMDGEWVPYGDAKVHVLTHTLHYGLGAFEGIRAYKQPDGRPGIWRLDQHLERLLDSMRITLMPSPYSLDELKLVCGDVVLRNGFEEAYIRPLAYIGEGSMGLGARTNRIRVSVAAWEWGAYLGEEGMKKGVSLKTSTFTRNHPNAAPAHAKIVGHYVNSILARYEANDDGFDEALMLDHRGLVAEGTGENLFVVRKGKVYTPPPINILPGITRQSVIDLMRLDDIEVIEQPLARDALYVADEVFMCGTAAEVTPVRSLDRRDIGKGKPGPITKRMQERYQAAVHGEIDVLQEDITVVDPR
ncbi:MAG: branched-chain amino acid transaminase [Myxococcota bacterium]